MHSELGGIRLVDGASPTNRPNSKCASGRRRWKCAVVVVGALLGSATKAEAPRLVKSIPADGDENVDPKLKQIRFEFDQEMSRDGYSICGGGDQFPEIPAKGKWIDGRTFVIPVKLKADWQYQISVNCPAGMRFKNENGESVEPTPISFKTGRARAGGGKLTPDDNKASIAELRRAIEENYSYRDRLKLDWDNLFSAHAPALEKAENPLAFARASGKMLAAAQDLHIWLKVDEKIVGSHSRRVPPNCNLKTLSRVVPNWKKHNESIYTGQFEDGVGYILIASLDAADGGTWMEPAYEFLSELDPAGRIIIDVRPNAGGSENVGRDFAGCFARKQTVYSMHDVRDASRPSGFSEPMSRIIEPKKGRPAFRGTVAVLMGRHNMSSAESLLCMFRYGAKAMLFGEASYGSSGNPQATALPNGVIVFLSSWRDMLPDGTMIEGVGITPDVEVKAEPKDFEESDPVLDAALAWIRR